MKPNLLVVHPHAAESDPVIDQLCETFCETHYVYLIRPIPTILDDSPAGVRFLNFSLDRLPGFGEVEKVIVVDSSEITDRLKETYPNASHSFWDRKASEDFPFNPGPSFSNTVIRGDFGRPTEAEPLARAM